MMQEHAVADATLEAAQLPAQAWERAPVAPWSRFAARSLDTLLVGFVGSVVIELVLLFGFQTSLEVVLPLAVMQSFLVLLLTAPGVALMYGYTGTTPGKFLFGVRVEGIHGGAPGLSRALLREGDVLVRGLGLGVPIIALITQICGYTTLTRKGESSWDGDARGTVVLYRAPGATRTSLAAVGIVLLVAGYALLTVLVANT